MLKKLKILLMDSEKNSCDEMQEFIQREGFIVLTAHSAAEGQLVLQRMPIDILILDIRLPDANGLEVLKESKSRYPKLEVIVISGHGDMDSVIQALHLGALDFLRKPLRLMDLQSAIERSQKSQINDIAIFLPNEKIPLSLRPSVKIVGR
ncbi:MAG TPA: response regulator [Bacteroidales bacterium]|nr:response regulator [Bacteroidales bacterium]